MSSASDSAFWYRRRLDCITSRAADSKKNKSPVAYSSSTPSSSSWPATLLLDAMTATAADNRLRVIG